MNDVTERITTYLINGGAFNPELADHSAVRNLLIDARAELDALRELLREAREYTGYAAYGDRIEADHAVDLCARIDAALNKGGGDEG